MYVYKHQNSFIASSSSSLYISLLNYNYNFIITSFLIINHYWTFLLFHSVFTPKIEKKNVFQLIDYVCKVWNIHLSLLIRRRDAVQKPHSTIITATSGYWKQLQYGFRALITSIRPPPSCYLRLSGTQTSPHYFYSTGIIMAYRVADGSSFPSQYGVECYSPISQDQMWKAL